MLRESSIVIHPTPQIFTINELKGLYDEGQIDFNAEYQRSMVWNKDKKRKLIDSVLRNFSIGLLILRKKGDIYEVLDGQQRLRTIFEFMDLDKGFNTSEKWTPEFPNKVYADVVNDRGLFADFISYKIPYLLVESSDEKKVTEIFLRLQEGLALNIPEKLNAKLGKLRDTIIDLSKYGGLLESTGIGKRRFAHRLLTAQTFYIEKETRWDATIPLFPQQVRFQELEKMYNDYEVINPPANTVSGIKRVFKLLKGTLPPKLIRKRSDFLTVYLLMSYLDRRYVITNQFKHIFKDFVVDFISKIEKVDMRSPGKGDEDYARYRINRRFISSLERFEIMLKYLLERIPSLILKDNKRDFDYGQKLAIYHKANRRCQYPSCGRAQEEVSFGEAHFHHIKRWIDGGPTTVKNGALMHPSCHFKIHKGLLEEE